MIELDDAAERRFIERLQQRDERAFIELMQLYQERVYKLVLRMLGRRDEAEDMAQEVFVQVFKAIASFRGDSRLSTWIYRIAVNLCKNRIKYLGRRRSDTQDEFQAREDRNEHAGAPGVTSSELSRPDQLVEGYQMQRIVELAIVRMDPDFREILVLRDIEDLSYEELSEITGLPDGTVKSRLHRARAMLKAAIEQEMGEKVR